MSEEIKEAGATAPTPPARRYFGEWGDHAGMVSSWSPYSYKERRSIPPADMPTDAQVLFASYSLPDYEGNAVTIFECDGKLYEASGAHCSCDGLDDQWSPGEVSWASLAMRVPNMKKSERGYEQGFLHDHGPEAREAFKGLVASRTVCPTGEKAGPP